jgi:uncharacterized protein
MDDMNDAMLRRVLEQTKRIAVVGLSADPYRPSYRVAEYLQQHGYKIIPVNPKYRELLLEACYPDLASIPHPVDMVDVFRRLEACPGVAREAVAVGAKTLWLQLGLASEEARRIGEAGGMTVIMNRCAKVEHERLIGTASSGAGGGPGLRR